MKDEILKRFFEIIPDAEAPCAGCTKTVTTTNFIIRDGKVFHSIDCADKATAIMQKPQPKTQRYKGWDI